MGKKVLVTGGTGFTGSHLVNRLLEKGFEVLVLDNQKGRFYEELAKKGARISIGSVTDKALVDRLVAGCDYVQHLAAAFRKINLPKKTYWDVNVEGTRYLAESSLKHNVKRFVYCSTQGVHGNISNPPGSEDSPIAPEDYYQFTKYEGEKVLPDYMKKGLEVSIIRPTAIFGPGDPERFYMLFKMINKGTFYMFGNGKTFYHPVYIDNLVDGFESAMEKPEAVGQTFIIADEKYYSLNEIVEKIAKVLEVRVRIIRLPFLPLWVAASLCEAVCTPLKVPPPLFRRRAEWFKQNRAFDISKARKLLGYEPKIGFDEGLKRTARWYKDNGLL